MKKLNETQEMDQEIQEVYKLFAKDEQGVSSEGLHQVMNQLLTLKHEFYQDNENNIASGATPGLDGENGDKGTPADMPKAEKPEITEIARTEAEWLIEYYDVDQDGKLNLEEFSAIFMEKSAKFKKHYHLAEGKQWIDLRSCNLLLSIVYR